jgi:hypothetical protein
LIAGLVKSRAVAMAESVVTEVVVEVEKVCFGGGTELKSRKRANLARGRVLNPCRWVN